MGSVRICPGFGKDLIRFNQGQREPQWQQYENAGHTLKERLPLAAVLLLRLSGNSLLVPRMSTAHDESSGEGGILAARPSSAPHGAVLPLARPFSLFFHLFIPDIRWTQGHTLNTGRRQRT